VASIPSLRVPDWQGFYPLITLLLGRSIRHLLHLAQHGGRACD
jgi:hypothetical protein